MHSFGKPALDRLKTCGNEHAQSTFRKEIELLGLRYDIDDGAARHRSSELFFEKCSRSRLVLGKPQLVFSGENRCGH